MVCVGCAVQSPQPQVPVFTLRNPTAPVGSQADVTLTEMVGAWAPRVKVSGQWPIRTDPVQFAVENGNLAILTDVAACTTDGTCATNTLAVIYRQTVAGRFVRVTGQDVETGPHPNEIWVYWFDFDRRTMAIGDPNGGYVAILDRSAAGGGDRIAAAKDILEWYGYDMARLEEVDS